MATLGEFFSRQKTVFRQQQEIKKLNTELQTLRAQNESMREGMRRCTTCEYRIDFKQRQAQQGPGSDSDPAT